MGGRRASVVARPSHTRCSYRFLAPRQRQTRFRPILPQSTLRLRRKVSKGATSPRRGNGIGPSRPPRARKAAILRFPALASPCRVPPSPWNTLEFRAFLFGCICACPALNALSAGPFRDRWIESVFVVPFGFGRERRFHARQVSSPRKPLEPIGDRRSTIRGTQPATVQGRIGGFDI